MADNLNSKEKLFYSIIEKLIFKEWNEVSQRKVTAWKSLIEIVLPNLNALKYCLTYQ